LKSTDPITIRLEPTPGSVAMSRVFVGRILGAAGVRGQDIEDARIAVSDIASGLVEAGAAIQIEAVLRTGGATLSGNCAPDLPEAGRLLLGDRLRVDGQTWVIDFA
jgi:hypothetical protein